MTNLSLETKVPQPPIILNYGQPKIGKSTMGAMADRPVFVPTEKGVNNIDAPSYPLSKSFEQFKSYLVELYEKPHDYHTAVIDTVDHLEPLVWQQLMLDRPKNEKGYLVKSIEDYGFGNGYSMAIDYWREYLDLIEALRTDRKMTIIQLAHSEIKRFNDPRNEPYDKYQIKIHKRAAELIGEVSDIIFFTGYYVATTKTELGFGAKKTRAIGDGERVLYAEERPAFIAGNRYGLPAEIPFDKDGAYWGVIAEHIPFFNQTQTQE